MPMIGQWWNPSSVFEFTLRFWLSPLILPLYFSLSLRPLEIHSTGYQNLLLFLRKKIPWYSVETTCLPKSMKKGAATTRCTFVRHKGTRQKKPKCKHWHRKLSPKVSTKDEFKGYRVSAVCRNGRREKMEKNINSRQNRKRDQFAVGRQKCEQKCPHRIECASKNEARVESASIKLTDAQTHTHLV